MRNTLDMDATIKGFDLEKYNLENILNEIFNIDLVDITTGDVIVPKEVNYKFELMFENRSIEILAYNMETIKESEALKDHWKKYQSKFGYAEDISYEDTMKVLEEIKKII